jgi:hypothetical protein
MRSPAEAQEPPDVSPSPSPRDSAPEAALSFGTDLQGGRALQAVVDLCRELSHAGALLGLGVRVRGATLGLELTTPMGDRVDVRVGHTCRHFVVRPAMCCHPIDDVRGAARRITDYLGGRTRPPAPRRSSRSGLAHLEDLAETLTNEGLVCRIINDPPVRLRVTWAGAPMVGETITVVSSSAGFGGNPDLWFRGSLDVLLAPCSRGEEAVEVVVGMMRRFPPPQ